MHSSMFTRDAMKYMQQKIIELEERQVEMNDEINRLYVENAMLKDKKKGQSYSQINSLSCINMIHLGQQKVLKIIRDGMKKRKNMKKKSKS